MFENDHIYSHLIKNRSFIKRFYKRMRRQIKMYKLYKYMYFFRMDIDHSGRYLAQKFYKIRDPDYYEFEGNAACKTVLIYFHQI